MVVAAVAGGGVSDALTVAAPSCEGTEYGTFSDMKVAFWGGI